MTFSRSNRREREERRERTSNYLPGGPGFTFCQKHRQRFRSAAMCPVCVPPMVARTR